MQMTEDGLRFDIWEAVLILGSQLGCKYLDTKQDSHLLEILADC